MGLSPQMANGSTHPPGRAEKSAVPLLLIGSNQMGVSCWAKDSALPAQRNFAPGSWEVKGIFPLPGSAGSVVQFCTLLCRFDGFGGGAGTGVTFRYPILPHLCGIPGAIHIYVTPAGMPTGVSPLVGMPGLGLGRVWPGVAGEFGKLIHSLYGFFSSSIIQFVICSQYFL